MVSRMSDAHYVYCLVDPRDETVRYVGCAKWPKDRLRTHYANYNSNKAMKPWIAELRQLGIKPTMVLLERCYNGRGWKKEALWWERFKDVGEPLLNPRP